MTKPCRIIIPALGKDVLEWYIVPRLEHRAVHDVREDQITAGCACSFSFSVFFSFLLAIRMSIGGTVRLIAHNGVRPIQSSFKRILPRASGRKRGQGTLSEI